MSNILQFHVWFYRDSWLSVSDTELIIWTPHTAFLLSSVDHPGSSDSGSWVHLWLLPLPSVSHSLMTGFSQERPHVLDCPFTARALVQVLITLCQCLKFEWAPESPGGLVNTPTAGPHPQRLWFRDLGGAEIFAFVTGSRWCCCCPGGERRDGKWGWGFSGRTNPCHVLSLSCLPENLCQVEFPGTPYFIALFPYVNNCPFLRKHFFKLLPSFQDSSQWNLLYLTDKLCLVSFPYI